MSTRILILKDGVIKPASSSDDLGLGGGSSLVLGTTSSTAYRGDYGNIAYLHSQITSGNPHGITKSTIGLNLVDNTADITKSVASAAILTTARTINGVSFNGSSNITINAVDFTARIASSEKGIANGVVPLNSSTLIDSTYLPSYVDDVLEYSNLASFPTTGETGKLYVAIDTNLVYRWSGSTYSITSASLALGTTSTTAFRGDYGNIAYLHSQIITGNPHNITKSDINLGNVDNTSDVNKPISTATQTALNLKANLISPSFTTPNLGTPSAGVLTNVTGLSLTTGVTGILPIVNGGTGSNVQNFVDLTTAQGNIDGVKTFLKAIYSKQLFSGYSSNTANTALGDNDPVTTPLGKAFNWIGIDYTPTADPGTNALGLGLEYTTQGSVNISASSIVCGQFARYRHLGNSTVATAQGVRLLALNFSTGTVTNLTGAYFAARNDSTGTVTTAIGGEFIATSGSAGTITNLIGGKFTASITNTAATTTSLTGVQVTVSSNNTVPVTNAIGVDIPNITGTATTKIPLRVGTGGSSYFNDTTASTSITTGAVIIAGGAGIAGTTNTTILNAITQINISGTKVIGARETGWTTATGTANKGAFAADTATTIQTAQRLLAIEQMLRTHGLIN